MVVLLALCSAVSMAVGIVIRQRATMDVPLDDGVNAVMFRTLVRRPIWWFGTGAAVLGFVFQALALAHGSLLLVQPLLVSALLFALPMSARLGGRRVTRGEWLWAGVLTAALAVFVVVARPGPPGEPADAPVTVVVSIGCATLIVCVVLAALQFRQWLRAVLLAAAVGILFGVVAVVTKVVVHVIEQRGAGSLATPAPYGLVALGVLATLLQQSAFHAGSLQVTVPAMLVLEPVVAVLLGALVLGEELDTDGTEAVLLVAAVAAMAVSTAALGRGQGAYEARLELEAGRAA